MEHREAEQEHGRRWLSVLPPPAAAPQCWGCSVHRPAPVRMHINASEHVRCALDWLGRAHQSNSEISISIQTPSVILSKSVCRIARCSFGVIPSKGVVTHSQIVGYLLLIDIASACTQSQIKITSKHDATGHALSTPRSIERSSLKQVRCCC